MKLRIREKMRIILSLLFITMGLSYADEVYSKNQKANALYKQGKYDEALKLYEDALLLSPSDNRLKMNKGSALYRTGDLEKAEDEYLGALSIENKQKRADAHYNLGNILFRQGQQMLQTGDQNAQKKFQAALENYIQALDLRPEDKDAKWNLQLAHELVKQLQQQQQNQDKNDNKDNKDKKDQNNQQNDKQQQDEKQQKQQEQDKNEENKEQQEQQKEQENEQQKKEEQQHQQAQEDKDIKKDEAHRLIEMYADDADSLKKPEKKISGARQQKPERDW